MTSFDFLSGFNNIDPKFILDAIDLMQTVEASDAEKEIMNMENYTIHSTMDRIPLWQTVSECGHWCGRRLQEKENSKIIKGKRQLIKK